MREFTVTVVLCSKFGELWNYCRAVIPLTHSDKGNSYGQHGPVIYALIGMQVLWILHDFLTGRASVIIYIWEILHSFWQFVWLLHRMGSETVRLFSPVRHRGPTLHSEKKRYQNSTPAVLLLQKQYPIGEPNYGQRNSTPRGAVSAPFFLSGTICSNSTPGVLFRYHFFLSAGLKFNIPDCWAAGENTHTPTQNYQFFVSLQLLTSLAKQLKYDNLYCRRIGAEYYCGFYYDSTHYKCISMMAIVAFL